MTYLIDTRDSAWYGNKAGVFLMGGGRVSAQGADAPSGDRAQLDSWRRNHVRAVGRNCRWGCMPIWMRAVPDEVGGTAVSVLWRMLPRPEHRMHQGTADTRPVSGDFTGRSQTAYVPAS